MEEKSKKEEERVKEELGDYTRRLNFLAARDRLSNVLQETHLMYSQPFSKKYDAHVYLKPENLQKTGSFKIRGAYNKVSKLSKEDLDKGIIAASAGNHAQGVAYAAKVNKCKSTIVMPSTTPLIKIERTKALGSNVVLAGNTYDEASREADKIREEKGYVFVHPFDDLDVIEGQGTIAIEILDELKDCDMIIVPIGGGGLISGVAVCAKSINPKVKIIGVEPEGAASMMRSLDEGGPVSLREINTIADGTAVARPGDITFELTKKYVDQIVKVSDFEVMKAFIDVLEGHKIVGETSGLLSVAALDKLDIRGKKVVSLISGGNIDVLTVASMVNKGLVANGRIFKFTVDLPDKPGQLLNISSILADQRANVVEVKHDQFQATDRFENVILEVTVETNGQDHIDQIIKALKDEGYKASVIY